ncbi:MAG: ABC transporter permease [Planctomycetota bacterium]
MNAEITRPLLLSSPSSAANRDAFNRRLHARPRRIGPIWTRLFWKEWRCSAAVLWVMLILIVVGFAWTATMESITDRNHEYGYFMTWVLAPFLAALGLPARLMGMENEDRTFDWLRTLPVSSHLVVTVKLCVAVFVWGLLFATASLFTWIAMKSQMGLALQREGIAVLAIGASSFSLLLVGLIACLLVRTTVYALLLTIPLLLGAMTVWQMLRLMIFWALRSGYSAGLRGDDGFSAFVASTICMGTGVALVYWLGHRRLTGASEERPVVRALEPSPYQSPSYVPVGRISAWRALLWQQRKQTRTGVSLCLMVAGLCLLFAFATRNTGGLSPEPVSFIVTCLVLCYLGVLSFHNDSKQEQIGFLAHHGLSSFVVWWTRLLPTLIPALLILVLWDRLVYGERFLGDSLLSPPGPATLNAAQCGSFLLGVACVQCCQRPSLAFFLAPILTLGWLVPATSLLVTYYAGYLHLVILTIPILLFATYRVTRYWMNGGHAGVLWRVCGYAMLAWLVVTGSLFAHRYATMPPDRIADLESAIKRFERPLAGPGIATSRQQPAKLLFAIRDPGSSVGYGYQDYSGNAINWRKEDPREIEVDDLVAVLRAELDDSTALGKHITPGMLGNLIRADYGWLLSWSSQVKVDPATFAERNDEIQPLAIEVALHWSARLREDIVRSHDSHDHSWQTRCLFGFIEPLEGQVVGVLLEAFRDDVRSSASTIDQSVSEIEATMRGRELDPDMLTYFDSEMMGYDLVVPTPHPMSQETLLRLVEKLPSDALTLASRRRAFIANWREHAAKGTVFGIHNREPALRLQLEQTRQKREVAIATLESLNQLKPGSAPWSRGQQEALQSRWFATMNHDGSNTNKDALNAMHRSSDLRTFLSVLDGRQNGPRYRWLMAIIFPHDEVRQSLLQQVEQATN